MLYKDTLTRFCLRTNVIDKYSLKKNQLFDLKRRTQQSKKINNTLKFLFVTFLTHTCIYPLALPLYIERNSEYFE